MRSRVATPARTGTVHLSCHHDLTMSSLLLLLIFACRLSEAYTRLVSIGDFGSDSVGGSQREGAAAACCRALDNDTRLDGILALGDMNYPNGEAATMDQNVGKHYGEFIWPLVSGFSKGAPDRRNRFFPCPGNHDWTQKENGTLDPYFAYLPSLMNQHHYEVSFPDVDVFVLDSDVNEDRFNGTSSSSRQAQWLKAGLESSVASWKLVVAHHPPHSSGKHGSTLRMQWPFFDWGATAVLSGHDHNYERVLHPSGFPFFVNGLGGGGMYMLRDHAVPGSAVQFTGSPAVQLIEADKTRIAFRLVLAQKKRKKNKRKPSPPMGIADCYEITKEVDGDVQGGHKFGPCSGKKFEGGPPATYEPFSFHLPTLDDATKPVGGVLQSSTAKVHDSSGGGVGGGRSSSSSGRIRKSALSSSSTSERSAFLISSGKGASSLNPSESMWGHLRRMARPKKRTPGI